MGCRSRGLRGEIRSQEHRRGNGNERVNRNGWLTETTACDLSVAKLHRTGRPGFRQGPFRLNRPRPVARALPSAASFVGLGGNAENHIRNVRGGKFCDGGMVLLVGGSLHDSIAIVSTMASRLLQAAFVTA